MKTKKNHVGLYIFLFLLLVGFIMIGMFGSSTDRIYEHSANKNDELITMDEFNQIQTGMTYEEVINIIGSGGTLTSDVSIGDEKYHTQIYTWYGNTITGANANVTFQNGKVVGKSQVGLK